MLLTRVILISLLSLVCAFGIAQQIPAAPTDLQIAASVERLGADPSIFIYDYKITNPVNGTASVLTIDLDISRPTGAMQLSNDGLPSSSTFLMHLSSVNLGDPRTVPMVPVTAEAPAGWFATLSTEGKIAWSSKGVLLIPAQSLEGFRVFSRGLPAIRVISAEPYVDESTLAVLPPNGSASDVRRYRDDVRTIEKTLGFSTSTIGPSAPPDQFDPKVLLNKIRLDLVTANELGWFKNKGILNSLQAKLDAATNAMNRGEKSVTRNNLNAFINEIDAQASKDISAEGVGLLKLNAEYLNSQF